MPLNFWKRVVLSVARLYIKVSKNSQQPFVEQLKQEQYLSFLRERPVCLNENVKRYMYNNDYLVCQHQPTNPK